MLDPPDWSRGVRRVTDALSGEGASAPRLRLPEPPEFRSHPFAPPGTCVDCGRQVGSSYAVPRCWECARPLCADCFWHHRLAPAEHRCSECSARSGGTSPPLSISGGAARAETISGDAGTSHA